MTLPRTRYADGIRAGDHPYRMDVFARLAQVPSLKVEAITFAVAGKVGCDLGMAGTELTADARTWSISAMMKFDHLGIPVTDLIRSRDWYVGTLGLAIEFEIPERHTVALQDSDGFTIFLRAAPAAVDPRECALWFQVTDVDATFTQWSARGVAFAHEPRKTFWGYGAELVDPDGYVIRLWDARSMKEK